MSKWYCCVGRNRYGPVEEDTLRQWVAQGRVSPQDLAWRDGMEGWEPVAQALGGLPPGTPPCTRTGPQALPPGVEPHRGTAVLVLGLVGLAGSLGCFGIVLGILAWVMGSADLRKMDEGTMDPSGRSMTQTGRVLGIIEVVLGALGLVAFLAYMAFIFVFAAVSPGG